MDYNFSEIEKKWQQYWATNLTFKADDDFSKPKFYALDMFPYPSGAGLHVGHPLGYIACDIVSRYKRHQGFNVLHPMGYDSFGLPAEQYAIQTGQHPAITTKENIARYREQLDKMGFSFDWSREVRTSDPNFYGFTQRLFLALFDSWYNTESQQAQPVSSLIAQFEKAGNQNVFAHSAEVDVFTAAQWLEFNEVEKEAYLQNYRLAYRAESTVNWCPELGTVLANDEVKEGKSERGGHPVVQKKMMQWSMRITAYAERLLQGLNDIDWTDSLKELQRNWIGKSKGASLRFPIAQSEKNIEVFTTRPDTVFGVSFMVLAPENPLVAELTTKHYEKSVAHYQKQSAAKSERDRMADVKSVTGQFTGSYAIHPFTGKEIPIWIGDYVLAGYGTGAVMAVPAHDSRDYAFAKNFDLPILPVVEGSVISKSAFEAKDGIISNSVFLNGLPVQKAIEKAVAEIEAKELGTGTINYRLRDAIFGRQRYWGEPIPIYYEQGIPKPVLSKHLPLVLPEVDTYLPTQDGEPPLARSTNWSYDPAKGVVEGTEGFPLETTTMPGWAGSSWYNLRYMDAHNEKELVSSGNQEYWGQVDLYIGGSEHGTGHLLYSRFWHQFMFDTGLIGFKEPFKKLINQGMILGNSAFAHRLNGRNRFVSNGLAGSQKTTKVAVDVSMVDPITNELDTERFTAWRDDLSDATFEMEGDKFLVSREVEKMSKSKFNVVNPDEIIEQYGADTLRMYEMFLGPLEQAKPWNTAGISGVYNFLKKLWRLYHREGTWSLLDEKATKEELKTLHTLIKKVNEDVANFSFNTTVSAFMICVNQLNDLKCAKREILEPLALLISPMAPHLAEELWLGLGKQGGVSKVDFPMHNEAHLTESTFDYPVAFNGKFRFKASFDIATPKETIADEIMAMEKTQTYLAGKEPKKVIVVPKKIVNIVM